MRFGDSGYIVVRAYHAKPFTKALSKPFGCKGIVTLNYYVAYKNCKVEAIDLYTSLISRFGLVCV